MCGVLLFASLLIIGRQLGLQVVLVYAKAAAAAAAAAAAFYVLHKQTVPCI
jgi:hypothetical protein